MTNRKAGGVEKLRATLAAAHPEFAAADAFERRIEDACSSVRSDLKAARKRLGIDQSALAEKMQVGQPVISRIENGTGDVGLKTLHRYVNALGLALTVEIKIAEDGRRTLALDATATAVVERALEDVDRARESLQQLVATAE